MAKTLKLSWVSALKQWRKRRKVDGKTKTFYLGTGNGKGDSESYRRALAKWETIEAGLDRVDVQIEAEALAGQYQNAFSHVPKTTSTGGPDAQWIQHNANIAKGNPTVVVKKLADLVAEYSDAQKRRYEHGLKFPNAPQTERISPDRYVAYRNCADNLKQVWGEMLMPQTEAELFGAMKQFRDAQQDRMNAGKSASTFNENIKTMAHFVKWLFNNYHVTALPRNWEKLVSRYRVESSARALEPELVRRMFDAAPLRLQCWIALATNCGFYSVDIANLQADAIQGDHLTLNRHKTGVPTRFKLWSVTRDLLKQTANKKGLAFTDEHGQCLNEMDVEKGTRKSKIDNQLAILKRKLNIKGVSFSNFRDTSSTKIESIDHSLTDIFDGHADSRMARFYLDHGKLDKDARWAKLDAAIETLGQWYGLRLNPKATEAS